MQATAYPTVNTLLDSLLADLKLILEDQLVGVYLHGSLVTGDFDEKVSDIDLVVVMEDELDESTFYQLDDMHLSVVHEYPNWDNRIEIVYISQDALQTFRTQRSPIGVISPGEPFHMVDAGMDWLMNWYMVREKGMTLSGQLPNKVIEPISRAEYITAVKTHVMIWHEWVTEIKDKSFMSYSILTTCRGLYTVKHGEPTSKVKAIEWGKATYPQWSELLDKALDWRHDPDVDDLTANEIRPYVEDFVDFIIDQLPQ